MSESALLRRADWRFLLPEPNPKRVVCFTSGRLKEALALVSGELVEPQEAIPGSCDLAVVTRLDAKELAAAWEALAPGGMFYAECYSPQAGGPPRIAKRMKRAGFTETDFYFPWPLPDPGPTLFWLPLAAPTAQEYFLANRPPSLRWGEGFTRSILKKAWKLLRSARLLFPIIITARKSTNGSIGPNRLGDDLQHIIWERWQEWGLGSPDEPLHWLMLTGGLSTINKVVKYAFTDSRKDPHLVVKFARVVESIPSLIREAVCLTNLESLPGGRPENVPRLLYQKRTEKSIVLGETVVDGHPLYTRLQKENYRSFAMEATTWISRLVRQNSSVPRSDWWPRIAEPALQAFEEKFSQEFPAIEIDCIREQLRPLQALPATFEHGDFSPWNVLVNESGELAVLDWEGGEPQGLPGMDLIYFLTFLAFFQEGAMSTGDLLPAYRVAQDPETFTGSIQEECLRIYFENLGLDPGLARPLRLLSWVIHSFSLFQDLGSGPGNRNARSGYPFIDFIVEELAGNGPFTGEPASDLA